MKLMNPERAQFRSPSAEARAQRDVPSLFFWGGAAGPPPTRPNGARYHNLTIGRRNPSA